MGSPLYREIIISGPDRLQAAVRLVKNNAQACIDKGTPIRLIITTEEAKRNLGQNKFYWRWVLKEISEQAWVNGRQYSSEVWHEFFARLYTEHDDVELPDGSVVSRRKSTSKMGVEEFAEYTRQVEAYAATELQVRFSAME